LTGWYHFTAPAGGVYYVDFSPPGRVLPTVRNQGSNETLDSDISRVGTEIKGRSALLTLGYGGLFTNVDAGFMLPANLNVFVFDDLNRNGTRQVGEALVPGAMVILLNSAAEEITRGANDNNGNIRFADLVPSQYTLEISAPNLYQVDRNKLLPLPALVAGDDLRYEVPLYLSANAVALASFTAEWQAETIGVAWLTAAELQTQGYHLYRGVDDIFDHAQRVTTTLIPGQGNTGGTYQVNFPYNPAYDPALSTLRFWLVEVEVTGEQFRYGPIRIRNLIPPIFLPIINK
jgi:SdrD B-like domain